MRSLKSPTAVEGDRVDELYGLMLRNPSLLGRLIYIGCLWNPRTGRYDRGLPTRFLGIETEQALRRWHHASFFQWLSQVPEERERDLVLYWNSIGGGRHQLRAIRELGENAPTAGES